MNTYITLHAPNFHFQQDPHYLAADPAVMLLEHPWHSYARLQLIAVGRLAHAGVAHFLPHRNRWSNPVWDGGA